MKRMAVTLSILLLAVSAVMFTACEKSEFGLIEDTDKKIVIDAVNASEDSAVSGGPLEAEEGDQIIITSDMEKGSVSVEIFEAPAEQSKDELPEVEGEPTITSVCDGVSTQSGTVSAGSFILNATCTEKATGTITVEVIPAEK